ncbi:carbon storage regulator [Virgibacillus natechei]|uniref:carbon storage regulator n=1 Tax=Virgibacillus sp. CBA3643 TaxID=2942278 RepID=UPI0035A28378
MNSFILDEQGREVEIEVMKADGNTSNFLRLWVTAPRSFKGLRGEIYDGSDSTN